jgi:hypothetical protein
MTFNEYINRDEDELSEIEDKVVDNSRWEVHHEVTVRRVTDDTYWSGSYRAGATENQETEQDQDMGFVQTWPTQVEVTEYHTTPPDGVTVSASPL